MEYKEYNLKDITIVKRGSSPRPILEYLDSKGLKWLKISDFSFGDKFVFSTKEFIKESGLNGTKLIKKGTLILTNSATPGIPIFLGCDMCLHDGFLYFDNINSLKLNLEYLYYWFVFNRNIIVSQANGSVFQNLKKEIVENLTIYLPTLKNQNKIVKILSSIDKKIESNNHINDNLYELSNEIFKETYKLSEEWEKVKIQDLNLYITDYVANGSFKSLAQNVQLFDNAEYALFVRNTDLKVNFSKDRKYVDKHSYEFLNKSKLFGRELIISNVGDVGSVYLCPTYKFPMTLGSNVIMLDSRETKVNYNYYLYYFFKEVNGQYLINGITGGSAQPKFNKTDFRNSIIRIPSEDTLNRFNDKIIPMYNLIEENLMENETLIKLRDTLLSKLMNGEIDLDNIEI